MRCDPRGLFDLQRQAGWALVGWGALSGLAGLAGLLSRNPLLRHAGLQSVAWGAIDAAIGAVGLRAARLHTAPAEVAAEARRFRLLVLVNALLDVGYIAGGHALVVGARGRATRAGAGVGIMVQGLFLLLFDSALTLLASRWAAPPQDETSAQ